MLAHPLDTRRSKSGISPLAPPSPQAGDLRLPPILRMLHPMPVPSCSKAPRGLFVLSRVPRIFTGRAISPSPSSRQRPDRYTIRAGRNLPDKEFRYLRTVIVTAAVHWGFGSRLAPLPLTFQHWAGVSPYTSAFALAETCVFGKQSPGPVPAAPSRGHAFSRSYGVNLPSSLTRGRSTTSAHLRLPTSVGLRYGQAQPSSSGFSRQLRRTRVALPVGAASPICSRKQKRAMSNRRARTAPLGPRHLHQARPGAGILTSSPSPTASALGLGPTNPTRTTLP
jgi:hypothetical protein